MDKTENVLCLYVFLKEIQKLKSVTRAVRATEERMENSAEHSWSVAVMAWLLSSELKREFGRDIDTDRAVRMALMHDIVEIEAGDASVWDKEKRQEAERREEGAFASLVTSLPSELRSELTSLREEFEAGETLESRIAKGVDRLSGALQRLVTGQGWTNEGHDERDLDEIQLPKIGFSTVLTSVYAEIKKEAIKNGLLERPRPGDLAAHDASNG